MENLLGALRIEAAGQLVGERTTGGSFREERETATRCD
jgi:hypothetical protein